MDSRSAYRGDSDPVEPEPGHALYAATMTVKAKVKAREKAKKIFGNGGCERGLIFWTKEWVPPIDSRDQIEFFIV